MAKSLEITLKRSLISRTPKQRKTVEALGLYKINQSVVHEDNPSTRGMIDKVKHLVDFQEVEK